MRAVGGGRAPALAALVTACLLLAAACATSSGGGISAQHSSGQPSSTPSQPSAGTDPTTRWPAGVPTPQRVSCPQATRHVRTAAELTAALAGARPGDSIALADGTYSGGFTAAAAATSAHPVWLCGSRRAVLQGTGVEHGYVLHLQGANAWRVVGLSVREGQKGVVVDDSSGVVLQDLSVTTTGDEGIHLRAGSSHDLVLDDTVHDTGLRTPKFGEGIYVGSAHSNWCQVTHCQPDRSDSDAVVGNHLSANTAEGVDIKEGTTGGVLADNTFDGAGMSADTDSWVDVKGNGWLIEANTGTRSNGSGFQSHQVLHGWGDDNTFTGDHGAVDGPGWGIELRPVLHNRVSCSNTFTGARRGRSNAPCT